jgi:hypothetical protein
LADNALLKTVLVQSAKEVVNNSNDATTINPSTFVDKIDKLSDTVAIVLKSAADNISAAVTKGDAVTLLSNMDKVTTFTQEDAGVALQKLREA